MSWTTPKTWAVGDPGTAADLNTYIRDNSNFLAGTAGATIATTQTTASTVYTDLTTVGPAATLTTGVKALVILTGQLANAAAAGIAAMAYAVSGSTTLAASDTTAMFFTSQVASDLGQQSAVFLQTGLTPGSNTFTAKYRVSASSGSFTNRTISVIPLP